MSRLWSWLRWRLAHLRWTWTMPWPGGRDSRPYRWRFDEWYASEPKREDYR